jgi:hypothetical protein
MPEQYLGDGLYAHFDGYNVILRAPREDGVEHVICIEPEVWKQLLKYVATLKWRGNRA